MHSADVIHSFWIPRFGGKRDLNPRPRTAEGEMPRDNHITFVVDEPGTYRGQCAEFCGASHAIMAMSAVAVPANEFEAWTLTMKDTPALPPPADTTGAAQPAAADTTGAGAAAAQAPAGASAGAPDQTQPAGTAATAQQPPQQTAQADDLVARGREIFLSRQCVICHAVANTTARGIIGPSLTRFADRPTIGAGALPNTQENLEAWIRSPRSIKAGALMPGTEVGAPAPSAPNGPPFPPTGLTDDEVRAVAAYLSSLR
jgi:cytochrome c oxidase subunit 2